MKNGTEKEKIKEEERVKALERSLSELLLKASQAQTWGRVNSQASGLLAFL